MIRARRLPRFATALVAIVSVGLIGISLSHLTYAASGSLSLNPNSASATVGGNLTVTIYENSSTDATVGVDAFINYSSNLQFVSASTVAPFTVAPPDTATGGSVEIVRGYAGGAPPTGNQVVSVVTFKVLSAGTGTLSFDNAKSSIAPATGSTNLLVTSSGGSYSLSNAVSPAPAPTPTPAPTPAAPASSSTSKSTSLNVATTTKSSGSGGSSSSTPVTVPNNGSVGVSTPVTVEPTTIQTDGVKKVEYYLGGKLVDTETQAPYKYNIDTVHLKNGTYKLVSKTYYTNGMTKQSSQNLVIKNTASRSSLTWLYALIVGIVLLLGLGINFIGPSAGGPLRRWHIWPGHAVMPGGGAAAISTSVPLTGPSTVSPTEFTSNSPQTTEDSTATSPTELEHERFLEQHPPTPPPGSVVGPKK